MAAREAVRNGVVYRPAGTREADDRPKLEVSGMDDYDDDAKKRWCCTIM